jgi:malate synthase
MATSTVEGVEVRGAMAEDYDQILTSGAMTFLVQLARQFESRRQDLLAARMKVQAELDQGAKLDFPAETASVREGEWKVGPIPADLQDRRVEITGPPERKMVINALNSGASVFMCDFEDSNSPTWHNNISGQINLRDAIRGDIEFVNEKGKQYKLAEETAVLMVRPRGWHLDEKGFFVDGKPMSGSLFDFGLYLFHNHQALKAKGTGPYFYLPKLEHYLEARLWNDVFVFAQDTLGVAQGTIRATVLIETITAAFQMDEILFELKEHSSGLNCGRWDYIFSYIKKHRTRPEFVVPNRAQVGMTCHFLDSYVKLLIQICHRRGIHAMGGMAAQIPIKNDEAANEAAMEKVRQDKRREVTAGHDGTWVAHPGLIALAKAEFDAKMPAPNQIDVAREPVSITPDDLLRVPTGTITAEGLKINVDVGLQYLEAWLGGNGCVPIYNLMEDAATAEISRTQIWQWVRHKAKLEDGRTVTSELVAQTLEQVQEELSQRLGERYASGRFDLAAKLFLEMMTGEDFPEFLTLIAYNHI